MALEVVAISVVATGRAGIRVARGVLYVTERDVLVERQRDEGVAKRVRVERGQADLGTKALDDLARVLAGHPATGGRQEDRTGGACGAGRCDRLADVGVQRNGTGLRVLALDADAQDGLALLLAEVLDIGLDDLTDPKTKMEQQQDEREVARSGVPGGTNELTGPRLAQPERRDVLGYPRPTHTHRKPEGVGDIEYTDDGFTTGVSIPLDEDGFLGRECPACEGPFKIHGDDYDALPEDPVLTCPYCGHEQDHSSFLTRAQVERVDAAVNAIAEQYVHGALNDMLGNAFGGPKQRSRPGSFISIETSYTPGSPPPIKALPEIVEERVRRIVQCSSCGNRHAVFSASSFCPICGPRPAAETVLEALTAAREALAMEDRFGEDERETLRAAGVFERFAVDAIESTVSLFEMFAREQFARRVADAATHSAGKGNVFQRVDDTAALFSEHASVDVVELVGAARWERLKRAFARRHVLTHNGGIVDQKFLDRVPDSGLKLGQKLVIRRVDAAQALDDVEAVVRAIGAA